MKYDLSLYKQTFTLQAFIATGFNLILTFDPTPAFNPAHRHCDYEKEPGKVRKYLFCSTHWDKLNLNFRKYVIF